MGLVMDFGSILSPEKWWLLLVTVLLGINTSLILPAHFDLSAPLPRNSLIIGTWLLNGILTALTGLLLSQEQPNSQLCQALTIGGAIVGVVTLAIFFRGPKTVVTAHDRRSELLGVLEEEYGQRETGSVLGKSIAPVPLEPPRSIPFLGKLLGFGQERSLSGLDDLLKTFDEAQRQVLILGEPGAGKTTLLVALANRLVQRAIEDDREPIPVILELSAWRAGESLTDWIVAEVAERYRPLPAAQVEDWLATGQLLPLLDGLDELKDRQGAAMVAINEWVLQSLKLAGVVVCCRREEYDAVVAAENVTLEERINKRIELQPLDEAAIRAHLHDCERDFLWVEIQQDRAGFRKLAESPLLLDLMVEAYDQPGKWKPEPPRNPHDLETHYLDCRDRLLDDYFEAQLHSVPHPKYKPADTRRYLEWLARSMRDRNQTEFLIEYMQPDLLGNQRSLRQHQWMTGFSAGLIGGLIVGLISGLTVIKFLGLFTAIFLGLAYGMIGGIVFGIAFGTLGGFENKGLIVLIKSTNFSIQKIPSLLQMALFLGMILGFPGALFFGINFGFLSGFIIGPTIALVIVLRGNKSQWRKTPGEGIKKGIFNTLILSLIACFILSISLSLINVHNSLLNINLLTFLTLLIGFFFCGGESISKYICLRYLLQKKNCIPRNYGEFLVYAADELHLLKRSGGHFRFYHDLLRERISYSFLPQPITSLPTKPAWQELLIAFVSILTSLIMVNNIRLVLGDLNILDLEHQDLVFVDPFFYKLQTKNRGDLVLAKIHFRTETGQIAYEFYAAQIIGLPSETITIKKSILFVNNISYGHRYSALKFTGDWQPNQSPGDRYLAITQDGNRIGYVWLAPEDIQAKMLFRIHPFDRFGPIEP